MDNFLPLGFEVDQVTFSEGQRRWEEFSDPGADLTGAGEGKGRALERRQTAGQFEESFGQTNRKSSSQSHPIVDPSILQEWTFTGASILELSRCLGAAQG